MIQIKEIAFTGYPVTDLARARKFYEELLGLKPSTTFGHGDKMWIEYDVGPNTLAITNTSPEWKPSSDGPAIAFEVVDFDAAVAALKAAAVKFVFEPMDSPTCKLAIVLDPDANTVAIHQKKKQG